MTYSDHVHASSEMTQHRMVRYHKLKRTVIRIAKYLTDVAPFMLG
jgi:hypothetical protein